MTSGPREAIVSTMICGSPGRNNARTGTRKSSTIPFGPRCRPAPGTLRICGFQVACSCSMRLTPSRSPALSVAKNRSTSCSLSVSASTLMVISPCASAVGCESDGQLLRTVTDGGHPRLRLPGGFERLDVLRHGPKERIRLEAGEHPAHTGVHTLPPAQMPAIVTAHIEPVRLLPAARIAVGGREHQAATLALGDHHAFNLNLLRRDAPRHA